VGGKAQVFDAVIGSLLAVTLRDPEYGKTHDLHLFLIRRKCKALKALGKFEEAERILQRAVTVCTSVHGSGHELSLKMLGRFAWLNSERL
jgi:hypothetical protein